MIKMNKWDELRDYVIQGLVQAEAGDKGETERVLRITLEKMDELAKKHHKEY
jgi:hypothetical protein